MRSDSTPARITIEAWREQQADRLNPIRFHFIDALERRSASHVGAARRVLDDRLSSLLEAYANDVAAKADSVEEPAKAASRPLAELLDHLADTTSKRTGEVVLFNATAESHDLPVMPALEEFRKTWAAVRSDSRLRQSLNFEPTNAGPLNSAALVHRSMTLMRELSPEYLRHFLAYVDDLSWLDQLGAGAGSNSASRVASAKKRPRKKSGGMTPDDVE